MPHNIVMPKLGLTMEEGTITKWFKKEGDKIKKGEAIAEITTDKITNVVEAQVDGILIKIVAGEGETIKVGETIGVIALEGEEVQVDMETKKDEQSKITPEKSKETKVKASPVAKKIAKEHNIDLTLVTATGPGGRITKSDVENYLKSKDKQKLEEPKEYGEPEKEVGYKSIKLTGIRKVIASRMLQSAREIPHVTEHIKVNVDKLISLREELKTVLDIKLSYNDLISKIVIESIKTFPSINACLRDDEIIYYQDINLGIAVATDSGLIVPIVKKADKLSFIQFVKTVKELAQKARESKLTLDDVEGGTFTITNLGMYGIDSFTPIIYPGQSAILGVNTIDSELILSNGEVREVKVLKFSLSFDHRVIDGADCAKFLSILKTNIENPLKCFLT
ncbi:MAG: dihydrolipoamide acetyltransferase family protein [Deferribacterota bacterium]|nr:dihydrolipoamide acetyltransferase family protein [Deferribacterota bacterium]